MDDQQHRMRAPVRVVFKQIMNGDRRKVHAESNDSDSGGGARDFRFNHTGLGPTFAAMFPMRETFIRRRNGQSTQTEVYVGRLVWLRDPAKPEAGTDEMKIIYEPPTDTRGSEGRIAKVHTYPPFRRYPQETSGMVLLLLVEDETGVVWSFYTTQAELKTDKRWNRTLANAILACIAHTPDHQAAQGTIDLRSGHTYCNASDRAR